MDGRGESGLARPLAVIWGLKERTSWKRLGVIHAVRGVGEERKNHDGQRVLPGEGGLG